LSGSIKGDEFMTIVSKLGCLALTGLFVANFALQASAQDAARGAAIHKCIIEAQKMFPNNDNDQAQRARTDVYMSCMRAAGMAP